MNDARAFRSRLPEIGPRTTVRVAYGALRSRGQSFTPRQS
jgi:hypothetical protein